MAIEWFSYSGTLTLFISAFAGTIALAYSQKKFWTLPNISIRLAFLGAGMATLACMLDLANESIIKGKGWHGTLAWALLWITFGAMILTTLRFGWRNRKHIRHEEKRWVLVSLAHLFAFFFLPFKIYASPAPEKQLPNPMPRKSNT